MTLRALHEHFDDVRMNISLKNRRLTGGSGVPWEFREGGGAEFGLNFEKLVIPFRMESGWLHIEQATTGIKQPGSPEFALNADITSRPCLKKASNRSFLHRQAGTCRIARQRNAECPGNMPNRS